MMVWSLTETKAWFGQSPHFTLGFSHTPRTHSFAQAGAYPFLPLQLLASYADAWVVERGNDPCLASAIITFPDGRRLMVLERTYREGIRAIPEPTDQEISRIKGSQVWDLWNSGRSEIADGAV